MRRSVVILLKFTRLTEHLHPRLRAGFFNYFSLLTGLSLSQEEIFKHLDELGQEAGLDSEGYTGSLWKIPIAGLKAGKPVRVTASTARDKFSHISPDGKRVAFQSARSGVDEIWLCDADGGNVFQLTNFGKGMSGSPRWSPDGRSIAFDSNVGNYHIYVIDVAGGKPRRLTTHPLSDAIPNWSRDGQWIYFSSTRTGRYEIWRIRPDGSSEIQVTKDGGAIAMESVDGKLLYYKIRPEQSELWKMPVEGGPATMILHAVSGRIFTVTSRGIYYATADSSIQLQFIDFEKGSSQTIARLSPFAHADVSPDERWLGAVAGSWQSGRQCDAGRKFLLAC
jgi:dipeptidyl aminopeptidase/acylaminoacyl peptidase